MQESNNSSNSAQDSSQVKLKKRMFRLTPKQKRAWRYILGLFILILLFGGAYGYGYNTGYDEGKLSQKNDSDLSSLFSGIINPFTSETGTVESIKADEIVVKTNKGNKKIIISDKTLITKKD